jgi:putative membrane protein
MTTLTSVLVLIVAAEHIAFMVLEMFLWTKPLGRRVFGLTPEFAAASAPLAKNQGLYNGFLAAGLIWGCFGGGRPVIAFLLVCVVVAGVYGAATVKRSILFVQAMPAAVTLLFLWLSR